jgi:hypothetical protein
VAVLIQPARAVQPLDYGKAAVRKTDDCRTARKLAAAALFWAGLAARNCPGFPYVGHFSGNLLFKVEPSVFQDPNNRF